MAEIADCRPDITYLSGMFLANSQNRISLFSLTEAESEILIKGLASLKFNLFKCDNVTVPSVFSKEDLTLRKMPTNCSITDLLHFDARWVKEKSNVRETPAVEALLRGLQAKLDFSTIIDGFHSEKNAFLEIVRLIGCFCKNITLNAMTYGKLDLREKHLNNISTGHLGMGVAETWEKFIWRNHDKFNLPGITLLWAMMNHRYDNCNIVTLHALVCIITDTF